MFSLSNCFSCLDDQEDFNREVCFLVDFCYFKSSVYWFPRTDRDIDFYPNALVILGIKALQYILCFSIVLVDIIKNNRLSVNHPWLLQITLRRVR